MFGQQPKPAGGAGLFGAPTAGAPANGGGLFGKPAGAPPAQGQPAPSLFGAKPAGSGAPAPGPPAGGLFGQPSMGGAQTAAKPLGFGAPAATTAPSSGLFGKPAADAGVASSFLKPPAGKPDAPAGLESAKPPSADKASADAPLSLGLSRQRAGGEENTQDATKRQATGTSLFGANNATPSAADTTKPLEAGTAATAALGASLGAAQPTAEQKAAGVAAVDPAQKLLTEQAAQDEAFKTKPLHYVTKKWQDQIRENETQFNTAVDDLRDYELMLIKSLAEIGKIETQSVQVKETYKGNMGELQDVTLQQDALLGELRAIEGELDQMMPQFMGGANQASSKDNKFLKQVMRNPDMYDTAPNRERVFEQALNLEQDIKQLGSELQVVNGQMAQSERNHAKAADLYLIGGDESKRQQLTDMEKTLENFYSSIKWIENATVDLKFQVDDIQGKIDTQQAAR